MSSIQATPPPPPEREEDAVDRQEIIQQYLEDRDRAWARSVSVKREWLNREVVLIPPRLSSARQITDFLRKVIGSVGYEVKFSTLTKPDFSPDLQYIQRSKTGKEFECLPYAIGVETKMSMILLGELLKTAMLATFHPSLPPRYVLNSPVVKGWELGDLEMHYFKLIIDETRSRCTLSTGLLSPQRPPPSSPLRQVASSISTLIWKPKP